VHCSQLLHLQLALAVEASFQQLRPLLLLLQQLQELVASHFGQQPPQRLMLQHRRKPQWRLPAVAESLHPMPLLNLHLQQQCLLRLHLQLLPHLGSGQRLWQQ